MFIASNETNFVSFDEKFATVGFFLMNYKSIVCLLSGSYLNDCLAFLKSYQWLLEPPIVQFYLDKQYTKIEHVLAPLRGFTNEKYSDLLYLELLDHWPSELKEYISKCKEFSLKRIVPDHIQESTIEIHPVLKRMKGMNSKKVHEVSTMSGFINRMCQQSNLEHVVDFGAGSAYLSYSLFISFNKRIIAVEGNPSHVQGAAERKKYLHTQAEIYNRSHPFDPIPPPTIDFITCELCYQQGIATDFKTLVQTYPDFERVLFMGLHCCGDFTPTIIRMFVESDYAKSLVCVGCCYNYLSTPDTGTKCDNIYGFPMSQQMRDACEKQKFYLSKMLFLIGVACYERWRSRDTKTITLNTNSASFRAILECVIAPKIPEDCTLVIRKHSNPSMFKNFEQYLNEVGDQLFVKNNHSGECVKLENLLEYREELMRCKNEHENSFRDIDIFQSLKSAAQPVIESLILIDRCAYLMENRLQPEIVTLFDASVSPRNLAIIANKP